MFYLVQRSSSFLKVFGMADNDTVELLLETNVCDGIFFSERRLDLDVC